jgi:hypothetical protein
MRWFCSNFTLLGHWSNDSMADRVIATGRDQNNAQLSLIHLTETPVSHVSLKLYDEPRMWSANVPVQCHNQVLRSDHQTPSNDDSSATRALRVAKRHMIGHDMIMEMQTPLPCSSHSHCSKKAKFTSNAAVICIGSFYFLVREARPP